MTPTESTPKPTADGLIRRTLRRRWIAIVTQGMILSVALMATAYVLVPPVYRAVVLIRVDPTINPFGEAGTPTSVPDQVALLTSPEVLTAAAKDPKVAALARIGQAGDPAAELRKGIQVAAIPSTSLIEVSAMSMSAVEAATVVNAVTDAFMASTVEWSTGMTRNQITSLEKYLADLKAQSADLDRKWIELVKRNERGQDAARPGLINADHGKQIQAKLIENDIKRVEIQARIEALGLRKDDEARKMIVGLETDLEAANILDRTLKAKLTPSRDESRALDVNDVQIALVKESRASLITMQEQINRRLEQLKFSSNTDESIRPINIAMPPTRPTSDGGRLMIMIAIPFATFALVVGLFAVVEYRSSRRAASLQVV